ncbi:MAG: pyridoxamine 5'-phosphate oxidase family protein [Erysipelotrichaceae bacterium]
MFRPILKKKNELSLTETKNILKTSRRGVLALTGDDNYPYAIPVNYFYDEKENFIIFHGSKKGHKVDSLNRNDKVCLTVIGKEEIIAEPWAPYVSSVIVFGRCRQIKDKEENYRMVIKFAAKYYPDMDMVISEANEAKDAVQMYRIDIEHISGKKVQEK